MLLIQSNIAQSFQSPLVRVLLAAIGLALLYVFYREVRKIPAKLFTLMITAFVDMLGLLMIIPLLPFYVKTLGGEGIKVLGMHLGVGSISGIIVAAFTVAQLASAPMWGRFSDRWQLRSVSATSFPAMHRFRWATRRRASWRRAYVCSTCCSRGAT